MMMQRPSFSMILCSLTLLALSACAPPEPADARTQKVDALFGEWVKPGGPGAALAVVQDGKIVYSKGYGLATLEYDLPITPQSVFYLGSVSKQFVTFSVCLLEQDGKLSPDDDVRKWIPELPDYGKEITLRHLFHHTSGIRDYLGLMELAGLELGHFHDNEGVIELIARQKNLNFEPGEEYLYSNSGYLLLAVIVERAAGKSLREFAQERIFEPLGMKNSHFHDDHSHIIKNRAFAYFPAEDDGYKQFFTGFDRVGSGGVFSSVEDLFLWDQNFYTHQVGGSDLIQRMHTRGILNDGKEIEYAFGLDVSKYRGLETVSHGGALGGYRSMLLRFPKQQFSVIVLSNLSSFPAEIPYQIADLYLADELGPRQPPESSLQALSESEAADPSSVQLPDRLLARWAGSYYSEELDATYEVEIDGKSLKIGSTRTGRPQFTPLSENLVRNPETGIMIRFSSDGRGGVSGFTLDAGRVKNIGFMRREGGGRNSEGGG